MQQFIITQDLHDTRLDKALDIVIGGHSRSYLQKIIKRGNVTVNGVIISGPSDKVKKNDVICVLDISEPPSQILEVFETELDIRYEDEHLIVINKPSGMTVHPGSGTKNDTLVHALLYHSKQLSDVSGNARPGIVHRLDRDTSGLMIVAKTNFAHNAIAQQIQNRTVKRKYIAVVWGVLSPSNGTIKTNIGRSIRDRTKMEVKSIRGKIAITHYATKLVLESGLMSLVQCNLETGRTHQIRVHMSHMGHSIVGDQIYGNNARKIGKCDKALQVLLAQIKRQMLHSYYIEFIHPVSLDSMSFDSDPPLDMQSLIYFSKP